MRVLICNLSQIKTHFDNNFGAVWHVSETQCSELYSANSATIQWVATAVHEQVVVGERFSSCLSHEQPSLLYMYR